MLSTENAVLEMNMGDNQLAGDVTYNRNGNQVVAHVNSGNSNVVERALLAPLAADAAQREVQVVVVPLREHGA